MTDLLLEPLDDLDAPGTEWDELAAATANPFATREFLATWWRHLGRNGALAARAVRTAGGELVAVLPLYWWRSRPLRVLRLLGHGPGDQLGPLAAPDRREEALRGLYLAFRELRPHVFLGEQLPADERWRGLLAARELSREGSPVVRFGGRSWNELLRTWSSNFREQVRRKERRLGREHELRFRPGGDDGFDRDLDLLFALHRARWRGGSSFEAAEAFQRDFAGVARARGWLRLWFLELDGQAVAAWYGLRFGGADWYYQLGRDPAFDRESVGFVLLAHTIREAVADGMAEYRFGRGGESYKYRFATDDPGLETIGLGFSARGAAALAAASGARAIRKRAAARALARDR